MGPPPAEDRLDLQPVFRNCGACHHLISIGPGDSVTDLRHKLLDGRTGPPENILQSGVAVTFLEMSEGYYQLHSWTHLILIKVVSLSSDALLQLLIELRRHLDEVSIGSSKWWHWSAVLPPFFKLCPGWPKPESISSVSVSHNWHTPWQTPSASQAVYHS